MTTWINCSMFGKRGEAVAPYIKKGTLLGISGEFQARPWTDKEGKEKLSLECRVNDLTLLSKSETVGTQAKPSSDIHDMDSDIPF